MNLQRAEGEAEFAVVSKAVRARCFRVDTGVFALVPRHALRKLGIGTIDPKVDRINRPGRCPRFSLR
jgi:hypothetical protein